MSIDLVAAALWLPIEANRKLVLIALCERADLTTGRCWPGRDEIAIRASLTVRSVTPHLQALEADGWIRSRRGNARAGETTMRWVATKRILEEGEATRRAFMDDRLAKLSQEDSSPDQLALGEDDVIDQGKLENDQGKLTALSGEAASLVTVIEPSDQPSYEPSDRARAAPTAPPMREGIVSERTSRVTATEASARGGADLIESFGRLLSVQLTPEALTLLGDCDVNLEGDFVGIYCTAAARAALEATPLGRQVRGCAQSAGLKGFKLHDLKAAEGVA